MNPMLRAALAAVRKGWAVLPLHSVQNGVCTCHRGASCKSPGKHPRLKDGVLQASADEHVVRRWWMQWPDAWLGVATGVRSGIWVLDVDLKEPAKGGLDGPRALAAISDRYGDMPATMTCETGSGGIHFYWRMPVDRAIRCRKGLKLDGQVTSLDVRGDGGYVVAPPSGHVSGGAYAWVIDELPSEAPEALVELVSPTPTQRAPVRPASVRLTGGSRQERYAAKVLESALRDIAAAQEGSRHDTIRDSTCKVAGFARYLDEDAALDALMQTALQVKSDDQRSAQKTIFESWQWGLEHPLEVPDRPMASQAAAGPPRPPQPPEWLPQDDGGYPVGEPPPEPPGGSGGGAQSPPRPAWASTGKPEIMINRRQMLCVVQDSWKALLARPASVAMYQRDGRLVRIKWSQENGPRIESVDKGGLTGALLESATWKRWRRGRRGEDTESDGWVREHADALPTYLASSLLSTPHARLPVLERVAVAPYVDGSGEIVTQPGYRRQARTFLNRYDPLPEVTFDEARTNIVEWLADFPFDRPHDFVHALGFMLTPIVRLLIDGPVPMHVFEAPTPGTGKSLLMTLLAHVGAGRPIPPGRLASNDEERRKALVAYLAAGNSVITLDNVTGKVNDDTLAGILTAYPVYTDRLMGGQTLASVSATAVWGLSGNNMTMSPDIARRAVIIRLDSKVERPEERTDFRIPNIVGYTSENCGLLRASALSLIANWLSAGRPDGHRRLGSFEAWSRVVGGIVAAAGLDGWLEGRAQRLADADPVLEDWRELIRIWLTLPALRVAQAKDLVDIAMDHELLQGILGDGSRNSQAQRMGRALKALRGRIIKVEGVSREIIYSRSTTRGGARRWTVSGTNVADITGQTPAQKRGT